MTSTNPVLPPLNGSLTLTPGFVDFHAKHNANLPWAVFPSRDGPTKLDSVSFGELAKASHRIAHRARPGREGTEGEVVGLLIHCDALLYAAIIHGLARAGLVAFPISPRLSPPAIASVLEQTNARRIISQPMLKPLLTAALSKVTLKDYAPQVEDLWSIYDVFPTLKSGSSDSVLEEGPYPERDTPFDLDEPVAVLHSSGSTGLPKAVYQTHRIVLQWASSNFCVEGRKRGLRWAAGGLPTLHAMGFVMQVIDPLGSGQAFAVFTPTEPQPPIIPTADRVLELARAAKCSAIPTVPSFIELWAQSEESVKFLASLTTILTPFQGFAGGPLSSQTGIKLVKAGVSVQSMYGSTEGGVTSGCFDYDDSQGPDASVKTSLDFEWMQFPPPAKTRFVDQGDGTYEMHYLTCETHQPAIENLPDTKGYATSDLFEPHPKKKGLWRLVGRIDDVIVLGTGEKIVPIPQESHISSSPLVAGAIMFGREKMQPGVLIEPHPSHVIKPDNEAELIEYRNKVWPVIAEANAIAPTFAKIYKEMILVADPAKPFPRAPKGTVIRKQAMALYTEAVENLYKAAEQSAETTGVGAPTSWNVDDIQAWLQEQATGLHDDISPDVSRDLFEQGFDSLSATFLRNRIISALRSLNKDAARDVSQNLVFDHPTIKQLAEAVRALASFEKISGQKSRAQHITELIEKYSADLPQVKQVQPPQNRVVLLTGSTGNIGSHILAALLGDQHISKVYTLDRTVSGEVAKERLIAAFKQRGLPVELLMDSRLAPLRGDLNVDGFGLDKPVFEEIKSSVSHIVHSAWKVDFNHGLGSFETQIAGTRRLVDFAASLPQSVSLLFTSSISVAGKWNVSSGPVPEAVLDDPEVATTSGYAASKYVVEQILARAAQKGLKTTSLRIGQVTGPATTGAWNTSDWVPILVKSSLTLGAFPSLPGSVSWIPVDVVANVVLDLVLTRQLEPRLLNVVHPRPIAWDEVFKLIKDEIGVNLPTIPYADWLAKLEAHDGETSAKTLQDIPALKLLEFFRSFSRETNAVSVEAGGLPVFSTTELQNKSETALAILPLQSNHARAWIRYWKGLGFLA
ncbi:hypothetical protein BDY19DRAFT_909277 [Irpex rosettiformis]|uniref:Uncharacterized protein n=1 Tax=Irpex rosettiformis TaxID=378272 RepID=A0ACB8TT23_9APHY|nr:hypothetical protein BDY19DRAFT_909277 [Irpex rosettiformis]